MGFAAWLYDVPADPDPVQPWQAEPVDDTAMLVGTGGTTGRPKGVMLTGRNLETMSAITLMSYPFERRPVYLALAPLTHAAGVLCFPILTLGGEIVIMPAPDLTEFLALVERHRVTHTFLPPTLIYMLLAHLALAATDLTSAPRRCLRLVWKRPWSGSGQVMAQLFGQSEAPMMISTMAPSDHFHADGSPAVERFASAGRPSPLVQVAIMADDGTLRPTGERGEIVVRGSLVMAGYYQNPEATAAASQYSAEVEQALMSYPAIQDCAVVGLPDEKWGERVTAVLQLHPGLTVTESEVRNYVKGRLGSVKAPKQVEVWANLPRSKVGKVLKNEVKARLLNQ